MRFSKKNCLDKIDFLSVIFNNFTFSQPPSMILKCKAYKMIGKRERFSMIKKRIKIKLYCFNNVRITPKWPTNLVLLHLTQIKVMAKIYFVEAKFLENLKCSNDSLLKRAPVETFFCKKIIKSQFWIRFTQELIFP